MAKSMSWWQPAGRPPANPRLPAAWFLADRARSPDPIGTIARLPRGVGVILRDYGAPDRADLARRVAALCRRQRRVLLIAGDARLRLDIANLLDRELEGSTTIFPGRSLMVRLDATF